MATGHEHVSYVMGLLVRHGLTLGERVLDFGCGVGRLSQALAGHAPHVTGVDIASSMVDRARELNAFGERVTYEHYDGRLLPFEDGSFDSAVSLLVVQHMPPAVQLSTMLELNRVVRPGGLLVMQAPRAPRSAQPLVVETCRAEITVLEGPDFLPPNEIGTVRALVANRGPSVWTLDHDIKFANHWLRDGEMVARDDGRTELPRTVAPGESLELELIVRAPAEPGRYELELDLVEEFVAWWSEHGSPTARIAVTVGEGSPGQLVFTSAEPVSVAGEAERNEGIEMHPVPAPLMRSVFEHIGAELLATDDLAMAGPEWASRTYLIRAGRR
ncbi:class I SAM-dependent methyltransferase [Amycolatopsis sp.]|uniref:class I SAM-dependent methyltransferase n=1 Tax=Amycolatopsis sp. TaxID=37632 RepID=UPI002C827B16|nr:class I SAM-dependent methyltransferase [Amycolatopsis sp.]HVV08957.1 class I SAM-dependent methyltransferase [Amycolatopsis sp.]